MNALKRCPFCGGEAKLRKVKITDEFYVECCNGSCSTLPTTWHFETEEEAIDAWNTRYTDDTEE